MGWGRRGRCGRHVWGPSSWGPAYSPARDRLLTPTARLPRVSGGCQALGVLSLGDGGNCPSGPRVQSVSLGPLPAPVMTVAHTCRAHGMCRVLCVTGAIVTPSLEMGRWRPTQEVSAPAPYTAQQRGAGQGGHRQVDSRAHALGHWPVPPPFIQPLGCGHMMGQPLWARRRRRHLRGRASHYRGSSLSLGSSAAAPPSGHRPLQHRLVSSAIPGAASASGHIWCCCCPRE